MNCRRKNRIKELRKAYGYTQEFMAAYLGVARQTYSHYENGRRKPDYEVAVRLSELYGKPMEELFSQWGVKKKHLKRLTVFLPIVMRHPTK